MYYFLSRAFYGAIIRVSRQHLGMCRQFVEVSTQCLDVSRQYSYMSRHVQLCLPI